MPDAPHSHIQTRFVPSSARVDTKLSVQGGGPLGNLTISLVNDKDPGGFSYYGTDIFGERGWYGTFIASGPQHAAGLVPDPGAIAGTTRYLCEDGHWKVVISGGGGGGSGTSMTNPVNQIGHGLAVGDVVRFNGTSCVRAKADTSSAAEAIGLVTTVTDADNFTLTTGGLVAGLSGLTPGSVYFLSTVTAGLLTTTAPTTTGHISKPLLIAVSPTGGYLFNWRGWTVGSPVGGGGGGGGPVAWTDITGKPSTFPPTVPIAWTDISGKPSTFPPTLPIAQSGITNLVTDLAGKEPSLPAGGTTSNFLRGDKTWAVPAGGGSVAWGSITGTLSAQTDLQTALNGKAAVATTLTGYGITDAYTKTQIDAGFQPLDSDLTAIAGLATTAYGRGLLPQVDGPGVRAYIGAGTSSFSGAFSALSGIPTTVAGYGITDVYTKTQCNSTFEPVLGNPSTSGYILSSTTAGVRSWIAPATGGGTPGGSDTYLQYNNAGVFGGILTARYVGLELLLNQNATVFTDNADPTKRIRFDLSNVPTATTRDVLIPAGTNPVVVASDSGATNNFLTGITALGVITKARPTFANLTSTPTTLTGYGITDAYTKSQVDAGFQPLDSDLTSIAGLATTAYGRGLLPQVDAAGVRTYIGAGTSSFDGTFTSLTGKPTTLSGYGITDAYTKTASDAAFAPIAHTHTFASLTSKPTTLSGYGITDAEPALGNPSTTGYVLSSTTGGVRSWIAPASGGSGSPGGSTTQFQYNNAGGFGGIPSLIYDGTIPATINLSPAVATQVTGLLLKNTTAATTLGAGYPAALTFEGQSWDASTTTSKKWEARIVANPIVGPHAGWVGARGNLQFQYQRDGGGWNNLAYFADYGGAGVSDPVLMLGASGGYASPNLCFGDFSVGITANGPNIIFGGWNTFLGSFGGTGLTVPSSSGAGVIWNSGDLAISRNAAGVLEINNGTAGTYRDLKARDINANGVFIGSGSVPTGGSTDQVLSKNSSTNYDLKWATVSSGGTPGGSDTYLQYNNAGAFGGIGTARYVSLELLLNQNTTVFIDNADPTKRIRFDLSNVPTATTRDVLVPAGGNPVVVASDAGSSDNFLTGITSLGVITKARPTFANLTSTPTTLVGYGIVDAYTKTAADTAFQLLANFPSASVDSEVVLFSGTTGKVVKRATGTGIPKHTAGVLSLVTAPTGALVGDTDAQTLTNKDIAARVVAQASSATWSPNSDTTDVFTITTAQATAVTTINNPSGTPLDGEKLVFRVKCDGTARALSGWGSQYRASSDMAFPTTLIASKTTYLGFIYNSLDTKWDMWAKMENF